MSITYAMELLTLGLAGLLQVQVSDIPYPPNAVSGATVVAFVALDSGAVRRVDIASGSEPFASAVRSSVAQWRFPADPGTRAATVVVKYREPALYAVGDPRQQVPSPSSPVGSVPYPKTVTEPSYPPNSIGEGTVVLRVRVLPSGAIETAETIKGLGSLTGAARDALKSWSFEPARDQAGSPVASDAYAVFVFRSPVLTAPRPK